MLLMPLLLSAITFNPAMAPGHTTAPIEGYVTGRAIDPDATCKPGKICASGTLPVNRNGCLVINFWNKTNGGTPLTIDVTETGPNGSVVYIYWVNALATNINIAGKGAVAKYYCP